MGYCKWLSIKGLELLLLVLVLLYPFQSFGQPSKGKAAGEGDQQYQTINATEVLTMLAGVGVQGQLVRMTPGAPPNILAQTPDGARFYIDFIACQDQAKLSDCSSIIIKAAMSNSGATYEDLNGFNLNAIVTKAVNVPSHNLIYFTRHAIVSGGIQQRQLQIQTALFLNDMQKYVETQVASTSVSYQKAPIGKQENSLQEKVTSFGQRDIAEAKIDAAVIDSAIYNLRSVAFTTKQSRALLERQ